MSVLKAARLSKKPPLNQQELRQLDAYWRAANDLTACQLADIVLSDAMGELSGCTMDLYQAAGIARRLGVVVKD